jgi:putative lipoic acid-binding regulatory protein
MDPDDTGAYDDIMQDDQRLADDRSYPLDNRPPVELLESVHSFPVMYQFRVIGAAADDFVERVLAVVREEVAGPSELDHSVRRTAGGRHVALTIDVQVQTAEQVRNIYARIEQVEGLSLLL